MPAASYSNPAPSFEGARFYFADKHLSDDSIHDLVKRKLANDPDVKGGALDIDVKDGVVTLRGHVVSREHRARAEAAARRVHGVLAVRNELVADEDLEVAVGEALGGDPRTRGQRIQVEAFQGVVHLRGEVSSGQVLAAAEEVAAGVPEVRTVVNSLVAPDATPAPARVLMPPVGVPIYATDGKVGRVDAVVISPRSRRVTGLVVSAEFPPDSEATPDTPIIRRRVVVPVEMVERSTPGGVDLNVDAATVANLPEYREEDYVVPDPGWQPPFDYRREYVRFALDAAGARRPELVAAPGGVVIAERERPDDGRRLLPIRRGQRVVFRDREVGVVDHVLVDPDTHQVTHFVVRMGPHAPKDTIVPVDWVARVAEESVVVEAGPEQLDALPARAPERAGAAAAA